MTTSETVYLVVRADRTIRVTRLRGAARLRADEIAFKIKLTFPAEWGKVIGEEINIDVPAFAPQIVTPEDETKI